MTDDYAFTAERLLSAAGLSQGANARYLIEADEQAGFSEAAKQWIPNNWPAFSRDGYPYKKAVLMDRVMQATVLFIRHEEETARYALHTYRQQPQGD